MIPFILFVPLATAMIVMGVTRRAKYMKYVALLGAVAALLLLPFLSYGTFTLGWFSVGGYVFNLTAVVAPVNLLLLFVVLLLAPIIFLYSFGFMNVLSEQRRFYLEMLAFEAAMLGFAMSGNFILFFISWEFLSLTSYLLIGFWHWREKANRAARKAITIVLIGDMAVLATMAVLLSQTSSLEFTTIFSAGASPKALLAASVLMMIAILTKSAQFPFQEWLPDAMEGPTPVSAFLHSSTMVKAGVFALVVLLPLFQASGTLGFILILGVITVAIATLNAAKEVHIKRLMAFSTVQELGLMMVAISSGALLAGVYFFFAQSFYKALLFFSAGTIMNSTGREDINETSGLKKNPLVYISTLFGVLSLAGFVPFSGFFASVGIGSSLGANLYVYIFITLISMLTSFYIFRWFLLNSKGSKDVRVDLNYEGQPISVISSMLILALLTLLASAAFFYIPGFLNGQTGYLGRLIQPSGLQFSLFDAFIETIAIIVGAVISYRIYKRRKRLASLLLQSLVYNSKAMNRAYLYFARFVYGMAEGFALFDLYLGDLFDAAGRGVVRSGSLLRRVTFGDINLYVFAFSMGMIAILAFIYLTQIIS